jgi:hypothetical protein
MGDQMMAVTIEKVEEGYRILPNNYVARDLRETQLFLRVNHQVIPDEWAELKSKLESTGKASIERSIGKGSQET